MTAVEGDLDAGVARYIQGNCTQVLLFPTILACVVTIAYVDDGIASARDGRCDSLWTVGFKVSHGGHSDKYASHRSPSRIEGLTISNQGEVSKSLGATRE